MQHMTRAQLLLWDAILDAIWLWEVSRHGQPSDPFHGRALFEAAMAHVED